MVEQAKLIVNGKEYTVERILKDGKKYIYDVFKYIDTDQAKEYTEFAKNYIGIVDWSEVIEGY